ncbi:MAG: hypothetical protein WC466_03285 [Candidatus Izemoplasmatales bacterium]
MDFLGRLNEISKKNKVIFDNIFKKNIIQEKKEYILQKPKRGLGYFVNGNYVYTMGSDGHVNPFSEALWRMRQYIWIVNARFEASLIYFLGEKIRFKGKWANGSFEGYEFMPNSVFLGGEFKGEIYNSLNEYFKVSPVRFISGKWMNPQNGILGVELQEKPVENMNHVELASVPVNWFIKLVGIKDGERKSLNFKIIKKLDDKSADFVFQIYPNLEKIEVLWEDIRSQYRQKGGAVVGEKFDLLGEKYYFENIESISIDSSDPHEKISAKNTINFASDNNLKGFLTYQKTPVTFQVNSSSQEGKDFVEKFKLDLSRGEFSKKLSEIRNYIASGIINGFLDEDFVALIPIFNNIKGGKIQNQKIWDLMDYLNKFVMYVINEASDLDTEKLISEELLKIKNILTKRLKDFLKIKKVKPEQSKEVEKDSQANVQDNGDEKTSEEKKQDFINKVSKIK